jgi:response regulator NasT
MNPTVGTRLLVVDDDRLVLATLARELRAHGYVVEDAFSADDALERCERGSFELALVDIRLPGTSGLDFARALRDRWDVPCVFLSAFSDPDTVRDANERGALGYLVKPLGGAQIVPAIETALARARDERTLRERERHLSVALSAGREASIAVGIVMAREGLDRVQAFELLRRRARTQRRKLADVAAELVQAAERLAFGKAPAGGSGGDDSEKGRQPDRSRAGQDNSRK